MSGWDALDESQEYEFLVRTRLSQLVSVQEPFVLISQVQRSGGTLLSQLLDGHPECHTHPWDLQVGDAIGQRWPDLDLARPETWVSALYEPVVAKQLQHGYDKSRRRRNEGMADVFPFLFLPRLQKRIFDTCVSTRPAKRAREVMDCYWTSYFNAWLDNQNLYTGPKRIVIGFKPRVTLDDASVGLFFDAYPDGRLISIVRAPRAWYASARNHKRKYRKVDEAMALWCQSADSAFAARLRFGDRVIVLTYEELVWEPERTMRRIAERLGITMSPVLLTPTFNGRPIRANTSSRVAGYGVLENRASAESDALDRQTTAVVLRLSGDRYERAAAADGR